MIRQNLSKFFRSKSFYVLLSVGAVAVLVIAVVGLYQASNEDNNEFVQLDEPISEVVEDNYEENLESDNDNKPPSSVTNKNKGNDKVDVVQKETNKSKQVDQRPEQENTNDNLLEYDAYGDPSYVEETDLDYQEIVEVEAEEVMKPTTLHFNHTSDKLLWPVSGNIIRKYSMDSLVHYATLAQWKVSPAMLISAEVGEEVSCSADGIIISIEDNEETGITVTSSIGDGYYLVYGQLDEESLTVEEGDTVERGQILGHISEPSRYNKVEGPSLYLQLSKEEESLNPMLCLE